MRLCENLRIRHGQVAVIAVPGGPDSALAAKAATSTIPLGQKIEAVEGIVPVRLSLVARCAAIGLMQLRIADLPIFVLGCCELHSQKQAQLKVGAFEPQPSVYQN
jgi:hypothetical protein